MKTYAAKLTLQKWPSVIPSPVIHFTSPPTEEDVRLAAKEFSDYYTYVSHSVSAGFEVRENTS